MPIRKYNIAVLDDYQNVALESADWSVLRDQEEITSLFAGFPESDLNHASYGQ
jgi:hypothetical protein